MGWMLKGGLLLLLHLGGLVPGCCASWLCTESVTAGVDGCTDSGSGGESEDAAKRVTARVGSSILKIRVAGHRDEGFRFIV